MYCRIEYRGCGRCGLVFRGDIGNLGEEATRRFYERDYFSRNARDQMNGCRRAIFDGVLDRMEQAVGKGRVLDVGCGCGFFLKRARDRGWQVQGIDPSVESVSVAAELLGEAVRRGRFEDFGEGGDFDAVTMINVLDHMTFPRESLEKACRNLKARGIVYLRFPNGNFHSALARLLHALGYRKLTNRMLVFHNYSFTSKSIRKILSDCGFSDIVLRNARLSKNERAMVSLPPWFNDLLRGAVECAVGLADRLSGGRALIGPSLEVFARRT